MRISLIVVLVLSSLLAIDAASCRATPSPSVWVTVKPLGINGRDFFYLRSERRNPGSYYEYSEMRSLIRCRTKTNEIVESILLSDVEYEAEEADDNKWKRTEKPVVPFDMSKYLRDHNVCLLEAKETPTHLKIVRNGIVDASQKKPRVIINANVVTHGLFNWEVLGGGLSADEKKVRLCQVWSASAPGRLKLPAGCLVVVESGSDEAESNFWQNVVFVPCDLDA